MKIGIDIDGVIADFVKAFTSYARAKGVGVIDKSAYPIFKRWDVTSKDEGIALLALFIVDGGYAELEPDKEAIKFLNNLDGEKFIITSRYPLDERWDKIIKQKIVKDTRDWLRKHGVEYDKIIFTTDKPKHVNEKGIDIFFEDFYDNAEEIGGVAKSFLITRDWNKKHKPKNSIRIDSIKDAANYIERI